MASAAVYLYPENTSKKSSSNNLISAPLHCLTTDLASAFQQFTRCPKGVYAMINQRRERSNLIMILRFTNFFHEIDETSLSSCLDEDGDYIGLKSIMIKCILSNPLVACIKVPNASKFFIRIC